MRKSPRSNLLHFFFRNNKPNFLFKSISLHSTETASAAGRTIDNNYHLNKNLVNSSLLDCSKSANNRGNSE